MTIRYHELSADSGLQMVFQNIIYLYNKCCSIFFNLFKNHSFLFKLWTSLSGKQNLNLRCGGVGGGVWGSSQILVFIAHVHARFTFQDGACLYFSGDCSAVHACGSRKLSNLEK